MLALERHAIPAHFAMHSHGHQRNHLVLIASGGLEEETRSGVHTLTGRCVRISRAHASHRLAFGGAGADCVIAEAGGSFWERVFVRALGQSESLFATVTAEQAKALTSFRSAEDLASSRERLFAFGRMLALFEGRQGEPPSWLDDAVDMLERGDMRSVAAIADQLARHRTHFARSFAAHLGFRPSEYRALRRIAAAAVTVRAGDARLCDVALEHGFAHQSHMTNSFRTLFGAAPARLRSA